jgi:hypothetical protein
MEEVGDINKEIDEIAHQEFEKNRDHYEELAVLRAMDRFVYVYSRFISIPQHQVLMIIECYEHQRKEEIEIIKSRMKNRVVIEKLYPEEMKEDSLKRIRI